MKIIIYSIGKLKILKNLIRKLLLKKYNRLGDSCFRRNDIFSEAVMFFKNKNIRINYKKIERKYSFVFCS